MNDVIIKLVEIEIKKYLFIADSGLPRVRHDNRKK
jgi:hypothetical protein